MSDPIRWGILGTGAIAEKFVRSLGNVADARVVAVGSRSAERARSFAERFGIARHHGSPAALGADDAIDVVYVASTHDRHHDETIGLLGAGRHVLCEKPLAVDASQAREMCDAARANDRFLMEAMWSRFVPSYVELRRLLDAGAVGEPTLVDADFSFSVPTEARSRHRLFDPDRAGGALLDLGVYTVHVARFALGDVIGVEAAGELTERGVDHTVEMTLDHRGGGRSVHRVSTTSAGDCTARIEGTLGSITLAPFMHATGRLTVEAGPVRSRSEHTEAIETEPASLHHQVPEVHRCIRAGLLQSDRWSWDDAVATLNVIDSARAQLVADRPAG